MIKILYLEDNKFDIELTQIEIKKAIPDCTIDVVSKVSDANQLLATNTLYDIAILDLNLPDGNGIDCLAYIRKNNLQIAVIILTGSGNEESATAALKAGADDYLTKKEGYLKKLPDTITGALLNFKKNFEKKAKQIKVIYIEWNKPDIDFTIRHMKKYAPHIDIEAVPIASDALKLLPESPDQNCAYDVILMDYHLPGLNALDTIKIIRQERKLSISIVLVTGHGNEDVAVQALSLGADEYLVKRENYLYRLPSLIMGAFHRFQLEQQQKSLRESESKYRLLAENSGDVIFIFDLNLKYTYVSPAVETLRGFTVEEALKQNLTEVLAPDSLKLAQKAFSEFLLKNGTNLNTQISPQVLELEMIKKDGSTIWTEVKVALIYDEDKNPIGLQGVTRDISKRKEALVALRKKSQAIEQSPVSVIITDIEGNIEYVNPYFTKVTGYTFEEALGKNPRLLKPDNSPSELYAELWRKIANGKIWTGELRNKKKDGTLFWESASISPIVDETGKITHYLGVKEDITSKKEYEQELIIARDQALESNRLKSAFLATMSHELRTPLNAIIGFSDLMNESMSKSDMIKFAKTINNSGFHLLSIIEDIFTVSLLQTKHSKINLEEFKISEFFKALIQYAKVELDTNNKQSLNIIFDSNIYNSNVRIKTDKTKIFQVLINFIKNAIKFTKVGEIEIGLIISNADITFYVKDTGIGIPKDKTDIIFEQFRQLDDSDTRIHDGIGLGLAICFEIKKLLNGKIWVESEVGKGSTFNFSLQNVISETGAPKEEIFAAKEPNFKEKTILIVDDEETNYILLETYLQRTNANTIWAKSGEESINICKTNPKIDLVLMDIRMPGIDGFEATKQIKLFLPNLTIIAQTAYALETDKNRIKASGFDDYLSKPVAVNVLMDLIRKHLGFVI